MDNKAQGALEYLLLIGGALIVAAVVIALSMNIMGTGRDLSNQAGNKATTALNTALNAI